MSIKTADAIRRNYDNKDFAEAARLLGAPKPALAARLAAKPN